MPKRILKKIQELTKPFQKPKNQKKPAIDKVQKIDQKEVSKQAKILERKEKKLKKQLARFARQRKSIKGDFKTLFPIFGRGKDEDAQEVESYESKLSIEHQLETDLQKVTRALQRMQGGKYGICINCGAKIDPERLKIYPEAEHCMKCHQEEA